MHRPAGDRFRYIDLQIQLARQACFPLDHYRLSNIASFYTYDSQLLPLLRACKTRLEDYNTFFVFSESDHFFDERDS